MALVSSRKKQRQARQKILVQITISLLAATLVAALWYSNLAAQRIIHSSHENAAAEASGEQQKQQQVPPPPLKKPPSKPDVSSSSSAASTVLAKKDPSKPVFVVGLMVSDKAKYYDVLDAEIETWLAPIPDTHKFVVAAKEPRPHQTPLRFVKTPCHDREIYCKRLMHIAEAHRMLVEDKIDFDWLLSGNEDWYVNIPLVQREFGKRNPREEAVVFTGFGCSQHWKYHKGSKNNTKPKPKGFHDDPNQCETLKQRGGVCGGNGIFFSRRAIEILGQGGKDAIFNRTYAEPFLWDTHPQGDPVLSCFVYSFNDEVKFEVPPLRWFQHNQLGRFCERYQKENKKCPAATVHAVTHDGMTPADVVRDSHKVLTSGVGEIPEY